MAGLHVPCSLRIVWAAPAILVVLPVPQRVKRLLPARCRDIQALAGLQIHSRRQDMHVDPAARFSVLDGRPGVAVRLQPCPGGFLELVHHPFYLRVARGILRRPGDHARGVLVLELQRVGHGGHLVRIAAQNFHFFRVLFLVLVLVLVLLLVPRGESLASEIVRRLRRRPGAVSEKLDHHRGSSWTAKVSSARSIATRCAITSTASAFPLWVFAQRAIWFRFEPIRASSRVRSRSTSVAAAVQVRVRANRAPHQTLRAIRPTERALACHSVSSALALAGSESSRCRLLGRARHDAPFPASQDGGRRGPYSPSPSPNAGDHAKRGPKG